MTQSFDPYKTPSAPLDSPNPPGPGDLNPWLSMWTRPRATMQQIIDTDPDRSVILLAMIIGVSNTLHRAGFRSLGDELSLTAVLGVSIFGGLLVGPVALYVICAVLRVACHWLGSDVTSQHLRSAWAWSSVIGIWAMTLWVPQLLLYREELFTTDTPRLDSDPLLAGSLLAFAAVELLLGIWSMVVIVKCLGQVANFSAWRALGACCLAWMLVLVPFLLLVAALIALK